MIAPSELNPRGKLESKILSCQQLVSEQKEHDSTNHPSHDSFYGSIQRPQEMLDFPPLPNDLDRAFTAWQPFYARLDGDGLFFETWSTKIQKLLHQLWRMLINNSGHQHFNKPSKLVALIIFSYANHIPLNCPELNSKFLGAY